MKGWLDNYNDSKVSVSQGFVGDGYNTKGRNYSPAWGGQFQDGGFIPIAQKGRDIPATRADSLAVYNDAVNSKNYYEKTYSKFYEKPKVLSYDPTFWRMEDLKKAHLEHRQVTPANKQKIRQNKNPNQYLISDMITGAIDPKAPLLRYDRRIKPQGLIDYSPKNYLVKELEKIDKRLFDDKNDKLRIAFYSALGGGQMTKSDKALYDKWKASHPHDLKNLRKLSDLDDHVRDNTPGYITTLPYYDPLAVKPFNLLTDAEKKVRVKKYGPSGVPKSYLNANKVKLNVDPKPNPNKKLNVDPKPKQEVVQPDLPMVEAVNLPPMQQLQSINPPAISDSIRAPKSYDVSTQRYNMQGPSDYYSYDKKDAGYEDILKANAAAKAYNKDIEKRYGPQNEYRTEKSRQEAARRLEQLRQDVKVTPNYQMGGSIPGAVGFSYARTINPAPDNGPGAKKTMASAQDGAWLNKYDVAQDGVQTWKKQQALVKKEKLEKLDKLLKNPPVFKKKTFEEELKENLKERPRTVVKESTAVRNYNNADKHSNAARNKTDKEIADERKAIRKKADANVLNKYSTELFNTDNWTRQNLSDAALGLESKFRVSDEPNIFDDYLNPANMIGNMASNLGQAPLQAQQQDSYMPYVTSIGTPLTVGALAGLGTSSNSQFVNNLVNPLAGLEGSALRTLPKAKSVRDALGTLRGIPTERSLPRLSPEELKVFRQVQEVGRMRATNKPISEQYKYALDQNLPEEHLQKMFRRGRQEIESILPTELEAQALREANPVPISERFNLDRAPRRPRSGNADDQLTEMFNEMPESLRSRIQAADNARAAAQVPTSLDDIFNQLDAGTHSSQTAPRVSSTEASVTGSRSQDIARAMETDRLRQMMGRWDDELNAVSPEPTANPVTSDSDDYLDFIEPDTSGPAQMPYDKERDYLQRYLSNQTNKVEDYANRTLYPKIEQFGDTADRIRKSQSAKFQNKLNEYISEYPYYRGPVMENVPSLSLSSSGSLKNVSNKVDNATASGMNSGDVFTGSLNTSHSSYLPQLKQVFKYNEGAPQFFGYKRMNHLGFLSDFNYSADDIAKYLNTEIDQQIKRGIVPDNILRPYATNKPNVNYQNVNLPHYGIKQFEEGGVIKDDRGQWAYPGEITEIGSNDITMEGVPYDVLGISDEGDTKLMKPGKNYKFKGKKVTEYPMAKNGLRQEQKGLVNLDQLTNFTNYNKPQPGGWLNKYN